MAELLRYEHYGIAKKEDKTESTSSIPNSHFIGNIEWELSIGVPVLYPGLVS
jgi:hypothetical protein